MTARFETFTVLINRISRNIRKIKNQEMAEYGLRSAHVSCLYYLYKENGLTATKLCEVCGEDKANISRTIKYLELNGFVIHVSKTQKKYNSELKLTDKGVSVAKHIANRIDKVLDLASVGMSEEHRKIMYESLKLVNINLNKLCD